MSDTATITSNPAFLVPGTSDWSVITSAPEAEREVQAAARKAADELRNVLLSSLQMQHLGVLAGSGCSYSAGGPTMHDVWVGAVGSPPRPEAVEVATRSKYGLSVENIEHLLSRIDAYLQVNPDDAEVRAFLLSAKGVILKSCREFVDPAQLIAHKTFLHRLSRRRVRDQRLRVFTTNYDLCFERAAALVGGVALDGFSFTSPRHYDSRYFSYDIIRRPRYGDDLGHFLEGVFLLYKLHGSVNWARESDGAIVEQSEPTPEQACLIYPANGKYQQSFAQPHLEAMAQYLATVREPGTCVIAVGFGFNDDHLSEPLVAAVESNPHMRLIVVDPYADSKLTGENRYWKTLAALSKRGEDVWLIRATFSEFADLIPDLKSLTPAESLAKALRGATRES